MKFSMSLLAAALVAAAPACAQVKTTSVKVTASADLAAATFTVHVTTAADSQPANCQLQLWLLREWQDATGRHSDYFDVFPRADDGSGRAFAISPGIDNVLSFSLRLPVGRYGGGKIVFFPAGGPVSEARVEDVGLAITADRVRVTGPTLEVDSAHIQAPGADGKVHIPYRIKLPAGYTPSARGMAGWYAMAKGSLGFRQEWADFRKEARDSGDALDNYKVIEKEFVLPMPPRPGIYNVQYGLFTPRWQSLKWVWPGDDVEVGGESWIERSTPARWPSVQAALAPGKAPWAIGGNFGNAIAWTASPLHNNASYFAGLRYLGMTFMRIAFNADWYLDRPPYRHQVRQIAENMLAGGLVPVLGPHALPAGATMDERVGRLTQVATMLATEYRGMPVMIDVPNEPKELGAAPGAATWAKVKSVVERAARAVKSVDRQIKVIVPFEAWSKDGRAAAADPCEPSLVDFYAWHPYLAADRLTQDAAGRGLPVMAEEYHDTTAAFHERLARLPNVKAIAAWAWTTPGQDRIPLVAKQDGAVVTPNAQGAALLALYRAYRQGEPVPADSAASTATVPVGPASTPAEPAGTVGPVPTAAAAPAPDGRARIAVEAAVGAAVAAATLALRQRIAALEARVKALEQRR